MNMGGTLRWCHIAHSGGGARIVWGEGIKLGRAVIGGYEPCMGSFRQQYRIYSLGRASRSLEAHVKPAEGGKGAGEIVGTPDRKATPPQECSGVRDMPNVL